MLEKTNKFKATIVLTAGLTVGSLTAYGAKITGIDFKDIGKSHQVEITADGPITYTREQGQEGQVVLELNGDLTATTLRPVDTSSFDKTRVSLINAYPVDGKPGTSRIAVQLREAAEP